MTQLSNLFGGGGNHTIASHSDTAATGAELDILTDNSIADTLHRHSELVASDGSPDPALNVGADGKVSFPAGTGINEFSTDGTLAGDSDDAVPTEKAVATAINIKSNNILINQDFSIWQENTTFTNPADLTYTADGYYVWAIPGGGVLPTINIKKNAVNMEAAFKQCCELEITNVGTADAGRYYRFTQILEDYVNYKGKTVTLTIRIKASVAITLTNGQLWLYDGAGSSTTALTSLTTSWQTVSVTRTIDASATAIYSMFGLGGGAISTTGSIYIQYMKLELGSVATPLIPRTNEHELRLCQDFKTPIYEVDNTYTGKVLTVTVDDASVVFGNTLYCASDFHYERCDADVEATMPCSCLALESGAGSKKVLLDGQICNSSWNWSAGDIYVSLTTGELTQTVVSGTGDQVQKIGWALSADTFYFNQNSTIVEII